MAVVWFRGFWQTQRQLPKLPKHPTIDIFLSSVMAKNLKRKRDQNAVVEEDEVRAGHASCDLAYNCIGSRLRGSYVSRWT